MDRARSMGGAVAKMTTVKVPVVRWALGDNEAPDGGYARPLYWQPKRTSGQPIEMRPMVRVGTITDRDGAGALMAKLER